MNEDFEKSARTKNNLVSDFLPPFTKHFFFLLPPRPPFLSAKINVTKFAYSPDTFPFSNIIVLPLREGKKNEISPRFRPPPPPTPPPPQKKKKKKKKKKSKNYCLRGKQNSRSIATDFYSYKYYDLCLHSLKKD